MLKPRTYLFSLLLALPTFAADTTLLKMVMPDAKAIAGLQVNQTKNSLFGQFVLSHMQLDDPSFKKFMADTGFDPRRDVSELLMASNWDETSPQSRWLLLARGTFDFARISAAALSSGGAVTKFRGVDLVTYADPARPEAPNCIAFFDATTAAMGDVTSVKAAIARQKGSIRPSGPLFTKVRDLSAKNDFWFVSTVPISEFASAMPDPNLASAMKGDLLGAIHQASGGVRFGENVKVFGEFVTRSEKDALALVDVVKFVAGLIQLNRDKNDAAGHVSTLLDNLELKTATNIMTMNLAMPEQQLEQMLKTMRAESRGASKKAAPPQNQ